jgi:acyl dehydratase
MHNAHVFRSGLLTALVVAASGTGAAAMCLYQVPFDRPVKAGRECRAKSALSKLGWTNSIAVTAS